MSWRPLRARPQEAHDPRLDPYRDRAALVSDDEGAVGRMYVQVQTRWHETGGRLWWRRWSPPYEVPYGLIEFEDGGGFDDWLCRPEDLDQELADWAQSRFRYRGQV